MTACPKGQGDGPEIHWALPAGVRIPSLSMFGCNAEKEGRAVGQSPALFLGLCHGACSVAATYKPSMLMQAQEHRQFARVVKGGGLKFHWCKPCGFPQLSLLTQAEQAQDHVLDHASGNKVGA